jgi:hypothetical protein
MFDSIDNLPSWEEAEANSKRRVSNTRLIRPVLEIMMGIGSISTSVLVWTRGGVFV